MSWRNSLHGKAVTYDQNFLYLNDRPVGGSMPTAVGNGKTFYVSSAVAASSGTSPSEAVATIDAAINLCVASRGDMVVVLPGHTEAVTSSSLSCDVAGVTFVGLGVGSNKPTLTFGVTSSRINVTAANCSWRNFRFVAGVADIVTAVLHATAAQNSQYIDIEFTASAAFNFINGYTLGAAGISNDCVWERNYLSTTDGGQLSLCVTAAAHDRLKWYNNHVRHAATVAGLYVAAATDMLGIIARGNFVQTGQSDGSGGVLIQTSGTASSGCVVDNDMKTADADANVAVPIASKIYAARNYIAGADEVGTVVAVGTLFDNT
jgi:hypothetical protein